MAVLIWLRRNCPTPRGTHVWLTCVQTLPAPGLMSPDNTLPLARPRSAHQGLTCCQEHVDKRSHNGTDSHIPGEEPWGGGAPPSQAAWHEMGEDRPHKLSIHSGEPSSGPQAPHSRLQEGGNTRWLVLWSSSLASDLQHTGTTRCHLPRASVLALTRVSKGAAAVRKGRISSPLSQPPETNTRPSRDSVRRASLPGACLSLARALLRQPDRKALLCRELPQKIRQWFPNEAVRRNPCELANLLSRDAAHHGGSPARGPGPALTHPLPSPCCVTRAGKSSGPSPVGLLGRCGPSEGLTS